MKIITVEDCRKLRERFLKYCDTAEQHQFPLLATINFKMDNTLKDIEAEGEVKNQKDTRAMFRVVLRVIGEDFSDYKEESDEQ